MTRFFQILFLSFCLIFQAQNFKIIQKPLDYSKERMKLSLDYMKEHHNLIQKTPNITPKIVVLHYTAGAIGVENIGSKSQPLTDKQVEANAELVKYLTKKYPIEYLIGHSEYGVFRNSKLWKESDPKYFTGKADPGDDFMKKVRGKLTDLKLKSQP